MKSIVQFVIEKLKLGKNINVSNDLSKIELTDKTIDFIPNIVIPDDKRTRMKQIYTMMKANKSYKRLCRSNMRIYSLFNTFICAICCEWDDAILYIKQFIHDKYSDSIIINTRNTDKQFDALLYKMYLDKNLIPWTPYMTQSDMRSHLEHYFDLCEYKYEKY